MQVLMGEFTYCKACYFVDSVYVSQYISVICLSQMQIVNFYSVIHRNYLESTAGAPRNKAYKFNTNVLSLSIIAAKDEHDVE